MNGKPNRQVAHLDEIERLGTDIPVREHLGIRAFGINAFIPGEDGTLINEHDEAGSGQEELYLVLDGHATFEVDGETIEAPAGTLVFVRPESRRKASGDGTILAVGATPGEAYQRIDWGRRATPPVPRGRAQRRRLGSRARRPAIRPGSPLKRAGLDVQELRRGSRASLSATRGHQPSRAR